MQTEEFIRGSYGTDNDDKEGKDNTGELALAGPCVFVQDPGQVVYVPRHWSHQVLNLEESIGFAVEILDYI